MSTLYLTTSEEDLRIAAAVIRTGGLVGFPTETVYGLGGNALDPEASKKIYAAKGRPSDNPLIVHISELDQIGPLVKTFPENAQKLAEAVWPGPMTLVLPKKPVVPDATTGGLDTVAVRMPANPAALRLITLSGCP
ncbi:MAG: threonylcarbamoyl-AMP synthase, partial [Firmicutes bacterium]|nr:threonylcarbamoyl-AMP synthase [Bacillota bacterium]